MNNQTNTILQIEGMSCGHCVKAVESALQSVSGVTVKAVAIGSAEISFNPEQVSRDSIAAALDDAGYELATLPTLGRK
ncbi:MAG: cation transporter [Blastocatellia bacterium]|nr:cation transporter [Blastocatellia bacterium]